MLFILIISYLKHRSNKIKFLYIISEFFFNSIVITFLYANKYIVYNFYMFFDFIIMLFTFKLFFHYFFNIKNNFALLIILNVFIFKRFIFISVTILTIFFIFEINLHFVFENLLIFLINVIIIIFVFCLSINIIIIFFFIHIFIIIVIEFFVKYNTHNNLNLFFIISINFLYLKY